MNVSYLRSYRSKNGNATFVYTVSGSASDLSAFADAQGEFYREDELTGKALWFTTRCIGKHGKLIITSKGNIVPDMSAFDQASSIAAQYGGNFGQELAKQAAADILGINPSSSAPTPAPPTATPTEIVEDTVEDDVEESEED